MKKENNIFIINDSKIDKLIKASQSRRMKELSNLTEKEFNKLKEIGMLWEFYPTAPEFYRDIKK